MAVDLEPLKGSDKLEPVTLNNSIQDFSPLRNLPHLRWISFRDRHYFPVEEFWRMDPDEFSRAREALKREDWEGAQRGFAQFGQALLRTNGDPRDVLTAGAVLAHGQDQRIYEKFCKDVFEHIPPTTSAHALKYATLVAIIRPCGTDSPTTLEAHRTISRAEALHPPLGYDRTTLGLAEFRIGNYEDAARTLQDAWAGDLNLGTVLSARAMAEFRLGNRERAMELLQDAKEKVSSDMASFEKAVADGSFAFRLIGNCFAHEAEALIEGSEASTNLP